MQEAGIFIVAVFAFGFAAVPTMVFLMNLLGEIGEDRLGNFWTGVYMFAAVFIAFAAGLLMVEMSVYRGMNYDFGSEPRGIGPFEY